MFGNTLLRESKHFDLFPKMVDPKIFIVISIFLKFQL